jgi:hypothetical protein
MKKEKVKLHYAGGLNFVGPAWHLAAQPALPPAWPSPLGQPLLARTQAEREIG